MNTFTCKKCGETFDKAWSDEEAEAEYSERFPDERKADEPREVWCDDCYKILMNQWWSRMPFAKRV